MSRKPLPGDIVRPALRILLTAALGQGIAALLSVLLLKRLDAAVLLIGRAAAPGEPLVEALARVFSVLRTASVVPGIFPSISLCLAAAVLLRAGSPDPADPGSGGKRPGKRLFRILSVCLAVLLFLAAFLLTLWRTEVNGIRFGDVLSSLIRTVRSGALDSL